MRGKFCGGRLDGFDASLPSMRPAHYAREVGPCGNPHHKHLVGDHCESLAFLPGLAQAQAVRGGQC